MRSLAALLLAVPATVLGQEAPPPGIYSNIEDAEFAEEEGREPPGKFVLHLREDRSWRLFDEFGVPIHGWLTDPVPLARASNGNWTNGSSEFPSEFRRARPMACWVSVRKFAGLPDGSEDWTWQSGLETFDQGGRVFVDGAGEAPDLSIRVRNVTWAAGSRNKPALVLYVHKDDPQRAVSYGWASPDADLVGINLRWVQASCSTTEDVMGDTMEDGK